MLFVMCLINGWYERVCNCIDKRLIVNKVSTLFRVQMCRGVVYMLKLYYLCSRKCE